MRALKGHATSHTHSVTKSRTTKWMVGLCLAVLAAPSMALSSAEDLVQRKAEILRIMHKKAKKALANAAQDHAFSSYFTSTDAATRAAMQERINNIALEVQSRFHAAEMCLIDPDGNEIARIVGDRIAHDLSHAEAQADFFAPGFAHKARSVYVSPAYLSEDADRWVVAYVTPIMVDDRKRAILHYEHGLEVYQRALNRDLGGEDMFVLGVDADGHVLSDSRRIIDPAAHAHGQAHGRAAGDYFQRFEFAGASLAETLAHIDQHRTLRDANGRLYQGAYARVEDWTLMAFRAVPAGEQR